MRANRFKESIRRPGPKTGFPSVRGVIYIKNHPYRDYYMYNGWDKEEMHERAVGIQRRARKDGRNVVFRIIISSRAGSRKEYVCVFYEPVKHIRRMRPHELPPGAKLVRDIGSRSFVAGSRSRDRDVTDARLRRAGRRTENRKGGITK